MITAPSLDTADIAFVTISIPDFGFYNLLNLTVAYVILDVVLEEIRYCSHQDFAFTAKSVRMRKFSQE